MGGSLQCDLTYATFHIGGKVVKVTREPRVSHILGEEIDKDATYFLDTSVNTFRAELIIQEVGNFPNAIEHEVECYQNAPLLWTMFFNGANSKDGAGEGVVFVSLEKNIFRYSFTLKFSCTNNIAKYEALLLGLKVASHHRIKKLHVIWDFELVISQIKGTYASKNNRLK